MQPSAADARGKCTNVNEPLGIQGSYRRAAFVGKLGEGQKGG